MTTPEPAEMKPWECFYDRSYYDLWAVRLKADRSFGSQTLFHLPSKEEAEALCDILNTRTPPAAQVAEDAVSAMAKAITAANDAVLSADDCQDYNFAAMIAKSLADQGFTIAPIAQPVADEKLQEASETVLVEVVRWKLALDKAKEMKLRPQIKAAQQMVGFYGTLEAALAELAELRAEKVGG